MLYQVYLLTFKSGLTYTGLSAGADPETDLVKTKKYYDTIKKALTNSTCSGIPFTITRDMRKALSNILPGSRDLFSLRENLALLRERSALLRHLAYESDMPRIIVIDQLNCRHAQALQAYYHYIIKNESYVPFGLNHLRMLTDFPGSAGLLETAYATQAIQTLAPISAKSIIQPKRVGFCFADMCAPGGQHYPNCAASALFTLMNQAWRGTSRSANAVVQYLTPEQYIAASTNIDDNFLVSLTYMAKLYMRMSSNVLAGSRRINYTDLAQETSVLSPGSGPDFCLEPTESGFLHIRSEKRIPAILQAYSEQKARAYEKLEQTNLKRVQRGNSSLSTEPQYIKSLRREFNREFIPFMVWPTVSLAVRFMTGNVFINSPDGQSPILSCISGRTATAYGCLWRRLPTEPLPPGELF